MATSGTIRNDFRTGYAVQLVWNVASQDVAKNTSSVRVRVQLVSTGSSYNINSSATKNGSVTINGSTYKFTFSADLSGNQTKTIDDRTVTVAHGSDGKKTCSFSFSTAINVTLSGTYYRTVSKSGSGTFNTIPRATVFDSITSASKYIDSVITYKYSPKSSAFYNKLVVKVGNSNLLTVNLGTKSASQQTGTLSLSTSQLSTVYSKYPKAVSAILVFTVETYSDSNYSSKVGTSTNKKLTLTFPTSLVPTISSVTLSEAVSGLATKFGSYVQNKSKVKVVTSASGVSGSTITSVKTTINGVNYTGATITSGVLTKRGNISISITVTDSRGRTSSTSKSITVVNYTPAKLNSFTGFRALSDGTESYEGTYLSLSYSFSIANVGDKNDKSYKIEYKLKSDSSWTTLFSGNSYGLSETKITPSLFTIDHAYDVRMTVSDYFGSDSKIIDISTAFTLIDLRSTGKGLAFGKVSEKDALEIAMETEFSHAETPSSPIILQNGQDLNNILTAGFYVVPNTTVSGSLLNKPYTATSTGSLVVIKEGNGNQVRQIMKVCSKEDNRIYERVYYTNAWGTWKKVFNGGSKILWSGGYYMTEGHKITLSEAVSEQVSGIVLVFSRYADGQAQNYGFVSHFVSKEFVKAQMGIGQCFLLCSSAKFGIMACKYLYINDSTIVGHVDNSASGTANGITYNNSAYVLRYVIGV